MSAYGGKNMKKNKIKIKIKGTKWDLSVLFKGDDDKEIELAKFFDIDDLPENILYTHQYFIKKYLNKI